jgi:O-antigen/teichoic acid export membrane protein
MKFLTSLLIRFRQFDRGGSISGTVAVNFVSAGLSALTSVVFARILGITNYGLYVYVISATGLIGGISTLGLPTFITRQTAAWAATEDWQKFNGIIRFGILASLLSSGAFGVLLFVCSRFLGRISLTPGFFIALGLGIGAMVLQCLDTVIAGALQGMHLIARSLIPQAVILPSSLIVFILSSYIFHRHPDAVMLLSAQLGISFIVEIYQILSLLYLRPVACLGKGHFTAASKWLWGSLPFWGNGILFLINIQADTLLLGYFKGGNSAAIYMVGTRGAQLVVLTLGAIATAIQPRLAALHSSGDRGGMVRMVTHTTRLGFMIAMTAAAFLFAFAKPLIRLLYGPAFMAAAAVLFILIVARLVNASVGSLAPYLAMTGKEHLLLKALAAESAANVLLNILLIPRWGMNGSAFATGISMIVSNLALAFYVYRRWGIDVSIVGVKGTPSAFV